MNNSGHLDYAETKFRRDQEWREAWAKMDPAERAELERAMASNPEYPVETLKGTEPDGRQRSVVHETSDAKPDTGGRMVLGRDEDAVTIADHHPEFRHEPDIADAVDSVPDSLREKFGLTADQATKVAQWHAAHVTTEAQRQVSLMLLRIMGFFLLPGNLLLRAHALAHAARMAAMNGLRSLRHSGEVCGVSVEAIRKVAWRWVELLGLPPLEGAKSDEACAKYSTKAKTDHWRNQKCKLNTKTERKHALLNGKHHPTKALETPAA